MAGTLTISTLSDGTNSTSSTNCIQGSAKAWVRWTGSNGAIVASYNVSSVTRNATGYYTIAFTNSMSSANYSANASACTNAASSVQIASVFWSQPANAYIAPRAGAFEVSTTQSSGGAVDAIYATASVFSS